MAATQILAATITIAFEGLMLFQGPSRSEKTHVAIVNAHNHKPYIEVIDSHSYPRIHLKKGDHISFGRPGIGYTGHWFDRYVVRLKEHVAFGNVDPAVVLKDANHSGTLAMVELPDGNLTILFTFPERVELDSWLTFSSTHCFPRYVLLTGVTGDPVTMTIKHQDETGHPAHPPYPIDDNGIVVISNGGPQDEEEPYSHFHEYRQMLGAFAFLETATFLKDRPCYVGAPQPIPPGLDPDVVEALSDRKERIPNGDCGATGHP
ncbi:MAG: hypothetical protein M3P06_03830 [Acidobacteriota bacterium]|nr:hypothetical protein [Acidobacteriota bacterium]